MKTFNLIAILPVFAFFIASFPVNAFAFSDFDENNVSHAVLAHQYEDQAKEMQAKIDEQLEALSHKPRTSFFGKHGRDIKKHVAYKIHKFEKAAAECLEKAAYHSKMAADELHHSQTFAQLSDTEG